MLPSLQPITAASDIPSNGPTQNPSNLARRLQVPGSPHVVVFLGERQLFSSTPKTNTYAGIGTLHDHELRSSEGMDHSNTIRLQVRWVDSRLTLLVVRYSNDFADENVSASVASNILFRPFHREWEAETMTAEWKMTSSNSGLVMGLLEAEGVVCIEHKQLPQNEAGIQLQFENESPVTLLPSELIGRPLCVDVVASRNQAD